MTSCNYKWVYIRVIGKNIELSCQNVDINHSPLKLVQYSRYGEQLSGGCQRNPGSIPTIGKRWRLCPFSKASRCDVSATTSCSVGVSVVSKEIKRQGPETAHLLLGLESLESYLQFPICLRGVKKEKFFLLTYDIRFQIQRRCVCVTNAKFQACLPTVKM